MTTPPTDPVKTTMVEVEKVVRTSTAEFERTMEPVRRGLWKRYPVVFLLSVTFGATATFTGIEQLLLSSNLLRTHPIAILAIGVIVLVLTGRVSKKLG